MSKDWIIEVLSDLHGFASTNGLPHLAVQLEEAQIVAISEIVQRSVALDSTGRDDAEAGRLFGKAR